MNRVPLLSKAALFCMVAPVLVDKDDLKCFGFGRFSIKELGWISGTILQDECFKLSTEIYRGWKIYMQRPPACSLHKNVVSVLFLWCRASVKFSALPFPKYMICSSKILKRRFCWCLVWATVYYFLYRNDRWLFYWSPAFSQNMPCSCWLLTCWLFFRAWVTGTYLGPQLCCQGRYRLLFYTLCRRNGYVERRQAAEKGA